MSRRELTPARLRELLDYNQSTGVFTWRGSRRGMRNGGIAGCNSDGYTQICIDGVRYKAHRLAWLYVKGVWPTAGLDHFNEVKNDNRISNLRECSAVVVNEHNVSRARSDGTSGYRGVSWSTRHNKWCARIAAYGKRRQIGIYPSPEMAAKAYAEAKKLYQPTARMAAVKE